MTRHQSMAEAQQRRHSMTKEDMAARDKAIRDIAKRDKSITYREIGRLYQLSPERISAIINKPE